MLDNQSTPKPIYYILFYEFASMVVSWLAYAAIFVWVGFTGWPVIILNILTLIILAFTMLKGYKWMWWFYQIVFVSSILNILWGIVQTISTPEQINMIPIGPMGLATLAIETAIFYYLLTNTEVRNHFKLGEPNTKRELTHLLLGAIVFILVGIALKQIVLTTGIADPLLNLALPTG